MNKSELVDALAEKGKMTRKKAEDVVDLISRYGGRERRAPRFQVVPFDLPRGNCATYFPEANVLVPLDSVAEGSRTPTSKAIVDRLERRG